MAEERELRMNSELTRAIHVLVTEILRSVATESKPSTT